MRQAAAVEAKVLIFVEIAPIYIKIVPVGRTWNLLRQIIDGNGSWRVYGEYFTGDYAECEYR